MFRFTTFLHSKYGGLRIPRKDNNPLFDLKHDYQPDLMIFQQSKCSF